MVISTKSKNSEVFFKSPAELQRFVKLRRCYVGSILREFVDLPQHVLTLLTSTDQNGEIIGAAEALVDTVDDVFHFWFSMIGWLCQTPTVETDALMAFVSGLQDWFGVDGVPGADGVQRGSEGSDGTGKSCDVVSVAVATAAAVVIPLAQRIVRDGRYPFQAASDVDR